MKFRLVHGIGLTWCVLLLAPAFALGGDQQPAIAFEEKTDLFRNLLALFKLESVVNTADLATLPAKESVVIVFGDLGCLDDIARIRPRGLKKFVDEGGALLIASDRADHGRLSDFRLAVSGKVPRVPGRGEMWGENPGGETYKGEKGCIKIHYYKGLTHPIFAGCEKGIATNAPSYWKLREPCPFDVLCRFPPVMKQASSVLLIMDIGEPFAVGSSGNAKSDERALFLSGHGVFMNMMFGQGDNDNLRFAINTLRWLTNNDKRKYCLFLDEGQPVASFNVPIGNLPTPTAQMINDLLRQLEEENFFNLLLLEHIPRRSILRWLMAAALVGLSVYGLQRLVRGQFRPEG